MNVNTDQRVIGHVNEIVNLCREPVFDAIQLTLNFTAIHIFSNDYDDGRQFALGLKDMFEARFRQVSAANAQVPNFGFNAESVNFLKRGFSGDYNEQLNIVLPSDNVGSVLEPHDNIGSVRTILGSLHERLSVLERLRSK